MNTVNEESKNSAIKALAIFGFIAVVIFGVWLAVKIVQFLPSAFSSLADIAEDVEQARPLDSLTIESSSDTLVAGDALTLSWEPLTRSGTYYFSYGCTDGVYVDIRIPQTNSIEYVECDMPFALPADTTELDVYVESDEAAALDFTYYLTFIEDGEDAPLFEQHKTVHVTNDSLAQNDDTDTTDTDTDVDTSDEAPVTPQEPRVYYKTITYIPQSDPNGHVDLRADVVATGVFEHGDFVPATSVDNDDVAAIRIAVQNVGTKTSDRWDLEIDLPNGDTYELENESGLKPNETAVLTIRFEMDDTTGTESFDGEVSVSNDRARNNNDFSGSMRFTN